MIELWIIASIGLLSLLSTILASKGSLFDKRFVWYNRLTKRGWIVAVLGSMIIGLSAWQYFLIKRKEETKEILQIKQQKDSDSTISAEIKKGVDSNSRQLYATYKELTHQQNLNAEDQRRIILTQQENQKKTDSIVRMQTEAQKRAKELLGSLRQESNMLSTLALLDKFI